MVAARRLGGRERLCGRKRRQGGARGGGLEVTADRVIAVQDRAKHNLPVYAYGVCKIFVLCTKVRGAFQANIETTESRYFAEDELPELAEEKNNAEQVRMCFRAMRDPNWTTLLE